jgi:hypothetical protein
MLFSVSCMSSSSDPTSYGIAHPARGAAVLTGTAVATLATAWALVLVVRDALALLRSPARVAVEELVVATSAMCSLGILLWVMLGLGLCVVAALPGPLALGHRFVDAVAPAAVRRWAALLLGVSVLTGGLPGAASAHETVAVAVVGSAVTPAPSPDWVPAVADARAPAPAPGWTPTPVRALPSVTLTAARPPVADEAEVTVRRGDTLWDLAAAHLSADATDAEVADEWHRWFQLNRSLIGADPDLILPGQILQVPTPAAPGGPR